MVNDVRMRRVLFFADRTLRSFDTWLKKGARGTDYVFPSEMLVQMNVIVDFKNQHRYNEDEFLDKIQAEMRSSLMERVSIYWPRDVPTDSFAWHH